MKKEINVFIISPNDVKEERKIAKEVCEEFNNLVGRRIEINAVLWEYHPMSYHKNAQENIDDTLDKCDIFVIILWHRLGSIVEGFEGAVTQSKKVTGTQYEIEKILSLKKEHIYFYFKREEKHFLENELEEAVHQKKILDTFLKNINLTKGSTKHGYQEFEEKNEFREKLTMHLKAEIQRLTGKQITIPNRYKKKQPITKLRKYTYMLLYLLVASIIFSIYIWYYFLPSISDVWKHTIKKENIHSVKSPKIISTKKYYTLEREKIMFLSTSPFYLHYRKNHLKGFNFSMAQWDTLSNISEEKKEAFILEKEHYKKYIIKEIKRVKKNILELSSLDGEVLLSLYYTYANSEDMYVDMTDMKMKEKLLIYLKLSQDKLSKIVHLLDSLNVYTN